MCTCVPGVQVQPLGSQHRLEGPHLNGAGAGETRVSGFKCQ